MKHTFLYKRQQIMVMLTYNCKSRNTLTLRSRKTSFLGIRLGDQKSMKNATK